MPLVEYIPGISLPMRFLADSGAHFEANPHKLLEWATQWECDLNPIGFPASNLASASPLLAEKATGSVVGGRALLGLPGYGMRRSGLGALNHGSSSERCEDKRQHHAWWMWKGSTSCWRDGARHARDNVSGRQTAAEHTRGELSGPYLPEDPVLREQEMFARRAPPPRMPNPTGQQAGKWHP